MYQKDDIVELILINKNNDYFSIGHAKNLKLGDQFIILRPIPNFDGWYDVRDLKENKIFSFRQNEITLVVLNKTHLPDWL